MGDLIEATICASDPHFQAFALGVDECMDGAGCSLHLNADILPTDEARSTLCVFVAESALAANTRTTSRTLLSGSALGLLDAGAFQAHLSTSAVTIACTRGAHEVLANLASWAVGVGLTLRVLTATRNTHFRSTFGIRGAIDALPTSANLPFCAISASGTTSFTATVFADTVGAVIIGLALLNTTAIVTDTGLAVGIDFAFINTSANFADLASGTVAVANTFIRTLAISANTTCAVGIGGALWLLFTDSTHALFIVSTVRIAFTASTTEVFADLTTFTVGVNTTARILTASI